MKYSSKLLLYVHHTNFHLKMCWVDLEVKMKMGRHALPHHVRFSHGMQK
jgi:hypothetical protein